MTEEKPKQKVSVFLIILTLLLAIVVTGFGEPGFLLEFIKWREPKIELPSGWNSDDGIMPIIGKSAAVSVIPIDGITVTAPENAFVSDRPITMTPLDDSYIEAAQLLLDRSDSFQGSIVGAWDLDAGLAEGELSLRSFDLTFNLSEFGIWEENYDLVTVFRQGEDGTLYELAPCVRNGILTVSTKENCPVFLVVGAAWLVKNAFAFSILTMASDQFVALQDIGGDRNFTLGLLEDQFYVRIDDTTRFRVLYYHKDDYLTTLVNRKADLYNAALTHGKEKAEVKARTEMGDAAFDALSGSERIPLLEQYAMKIANSELEPEGSEFQRVLNDIDNALAKMYSPEIVTETIRDAVSIFKYYEAQLGTDEMPGWMIYLYITPSLDNDTYASTSGSITIGNPYMKINGKKDMNDPVQKETLLLTMAHEYFHVLQRYKRNMFLASRKYDEATAMVAELRAYDYFKDRNRFPHLTREGVINQYDRWDYYAVPLDTDFGLVYYSFLHSYLPTWLGPDDPGTDAGYAAGHFLLDLFSKEGEKTYKEILDAYNWSWTSGKADFVSLVKNLFGINDSEFESYYIRFIRKNEDRIRRKLPAAGLSFTEAGDEWNYPRSGAEPGKSDPSQVKAQKAIADIRNNNYTARIRRIAADLPTGYNKPYNLLIVMDKSWSTNLPDVKLYPIVNKNCKQSKYGLFYEAENARDWFNFWMLELDGGSVDISGETSHPYMSYYYIYTLIAPDEIRPTVSGTQIKFKLPEKSTAAADGYIDGYRVTITPSEGTPYVEHLKIAAAGKERSINLSRMISPDRIAFAQFGEGNDDSITFDVSVCEYINELDGTRTYGPESSQHSGAEALMSEFGATAGKLQITLHWASTDDLDLHCVTPEGGHIYYENKRADGGYLEIDKNIEGELSEAIEHIYFDQPKSGEYKFYVVNYKDRTEGDVMADVTVRINNNGEGQNDPSKQSVLMIREAPMGSRSPTWTFKISGNEDPETGIEYIDGVPGAALTE